MTTPNIRLQDHQSINEHMATVTRHANPPTLDNIPKNTLNTLQPEPKAPNNPNTAPNNPNNASTTLKNYIFHNLSKLYEQQHLYNKKSQELQAMESIESCTSNITNYFIKLTTDIGQINAFIDTGATLCVINERYANKHYKHKIVKRSKPIIVSTGNGNIQLSKYIITNIIHKNKIIKTRFYLVPKLSYTFIIGRHVQRLLNIKLIIDEHDNEYIYYEKDIPQPEIQLLEQQPEPVISPNINEPPSNNINEPINNIPTTGPPIPTIIYNVTKPVPTNIKAPKFINKAQTKHLTVKEYKKIEYPLNKNVPDNKWTEEASKIKQTNIGKTLNTEQQQTITKLVQNIQTKYGAESQHHHGTIPNIEFKIDLYPNTLPIKAKGIPYEVGIEHENEINRQVAILLKQGDISISNSDWACGVALRGKKGGSMRLIFDYRALNNVTIKDQFPLPKIDDVLKEFGQKQYYTALDLKSGYFHIKVHPDSRHLLAFLTKQGLYEWNVLPFGPTNAPAFFQRAMQHVFQGLDFIKIYLDDILILSNTFEEHIEHIKLAFERVKQYNLKMRMDKCYFAVQKIQYLGHIITPKGIQPSTKKLKDIFEFKQPQTKKEMQSFVGLVNFIHKFIPGLSNLLNTFTDAKTFETKDPKADETLKVWTDEMQYFFNKIKEVVGNKNHILSHPDFNKQFYVEADASYFNIGAILYQKDSNNKLQPIECISKKLSPAQQNWDTGEKETYALVYAIEKWRRYLIQKHFIAYTDHKNLHQLFNLAKRFKGNRLYRWQLIIQEYNFTVVPRPGKQQIISDYLSRYVIPKTQDTDDIESLGLNIPQEAINKINIRSIAPDISNNIHALNNNTDTLIDTSSILINKSNKSDNKSNNSDKLINNSNKSNNYEHQYNNNKPPDNNEFYKNTTPSKEIQIITNKLMPLVHQPINISYKLDKNQLKLIHNKINKLIYDTDDQNIKNIRNTLYNISNTSKIQSNQTLSLPTLNEIQIEQNNDPIISQIIKNIDQKSPLLHVLPKYIKKRLKSFTKLNDTLYYCNLIYVPPNLRYRILNALHMERLHPGIQKTKYDIKQHYIWIGMDKDIQNYISQCHICQMVKGHPKRTEMQLYPKYKAFKCIHIDPAGPLPLTKDDNKYFITIIDRFTRYVEVLPVKDLTAYNLAKQVYNKWILKYGAPDVIISDQGTQFISGIFQHLCKLSNIKHIMVASYHQSANGMVERVHKQLKKMLQIIGLSNDIDWYDNENRIDWDEVIYMCQHIYNTTKHSAHGYAPIELVLGYIPTLPIYAKVGIINDLNEKYKLEIPQNYKKWILGNIKILHKFAEYNNNKYIQQMKQKYDRTKASTKSHTINVGDKVLYTQNIYKTIKPKKLQPTYIGPALVTKKDGKQVWIKVNGNEIRTNIDQLKKYNTPHVDEHILKQTLDEYEKSKKIQPNKLIKHTINNIPPTTLDQSLDNALDTAPAVALDTSLDAAPAVKDPSNALYLPKLF